MGIRKEESEIGTLELNISALEFLFLFFHRSFCVVSFE